MFKEKTTEIELSDGKKVLITQRRLNAGQRNRWLQEAVPVKLHGNLPSASVDQAVLKESGILKSIIKVMDRDNQIAFSITDLQNLDPLEFDKLYSSFEELMAVEEKKNP